MTDPQELLDQDTLNELRAMLEEGLDELLREYLSDSRRLMEQLSRAAEQGDNAALITHAHALKGSSGNLGVAGVYRAAERLEQAAREGKLDSPQQKVEALLDLYQRSTNELKGLIGS